MNKEDAGNKIGKIKSLEIQGIGRYPQRWIMSEYGLMIDPEQLTTEEIESKIDFFVRHERYSDAEAYTKELNRRNSLL